jgi:hypothetical protein
MSPRPPRLESRPPLRRIEDRIRSLCQQLRVAKDDDEAVPILIELRDALHRYIERLRVRLAEYPTVAERRDRMGH